MPIRITIIEFAQHLCTMFEDLAFDIIELETPDRLESPAKAIVLYRRLADGEFRFAPIQFDLGLRINDTWIRSLCSQLDLRAEDVLGE